MISDRFQTLCFPIIVPETVKPQTCEARKPNNPTSHKSVTYRLHLGTLPLLRTSGAFLVHHTNWTSAFAKKRLSCFAKPTSQLASNLWQTSERANVCRQAQNRLSWLPKPTYQLASNLKQTSEYANMLWPGGVRAARFNPPPPFRGAERVK